MSVLHVFNPSHDEALAANTPYYTAAHAAHTLETDLFSLPAWWANPSDSILCFDKSFEDAEYRACRLTAHPDWNEIERIEPWGWDAALCLRLQRLGAPRRLLPTDEYLSEVRRVSSRESAITLLQSIKKQFANAVGDAVYCETLDDVRERLAAYGGTSMLKAPWSCSGRGVFRASLEDSATWEQRATKIIRQQGGIVAEAWQQRIADFAMEFEVTPHGARYEGLSVFSTNPAGGYAGNMVADEASLYGLLPSSVCEQLNDVRLLIIKELNGGLLSNYSGPVGVDMMVAESSGNPCLVPCIEINVRRTMGLVALHLRQHLPSSASSAVFTILPTSSVHADDVVLTKPSEKIMAALRRQATTFT